MGRDAFKTDLSCSHCNATGAAVWEENTMLSPQGPQRRLVAVHGDFHSETGRTHSGDPMIVCNNCDTIQAD